MNGRPEMSTSVGGLRLRNPVIAASGTFGYGREYAPYFALERIGGLVTKGVSLRPRYGNKPPRLCETSAGMLNAIGLANVGVEAFVADKLPWLAGQDTPAAVNLYGESIDEFVQLAQRLDGLAGVAALELNVSCPNVKAGGMAFGTNPQAVAQVTAAVRRVTSLPLWVKLTPNVTDPVAVAGAAMEAGADALCLINTLLGMAIDARRRAPRLANVVGGLSGPAIKPVGLRMVWQVARALPGAPIIGLGGICRGEDAAEYLLAGASAVQVGTASFADPTACARVADELARFCAEEGVSAVSQLIGGLRA